MPPWFDLVVLFGIILSTGWWMARLRRRGLGGGRYAAASAIGFLGLALIATMTAHCIDVLSRLAVGAGYDGAEFVYNFRTYSLLLLGSVLIAPGCGSWASPGPSAPPRPSADRRSGPCLPSSRWWRR